LFKTRVASCRVILTAFALALVFASVHIAQHDLEESSGNLNYQDECQVCRLSHVPVISTPGLPPMAFMQVSAHVFQTEASRRHDDLRFPTLGARAPPLF